MGRTYKDSMATFMQISNTAFNREYWNGKGYDLGEPKPKSVVHKPRHQLTLTEALAECDTYGTMGEAFARAKDARHDR